MLAKAARSWLSARFTMLLAEGRRLMGDELCMVCPLIATASTNWKKERKWEQGDKIVMLQDSVKQNSDLRPNIIYFLFHRHPKGEMLMHQTISLPYCKRGVTQYFIQFQVKTWKNELSPFCKFCNSVQIKILFAGLNIWNFLPENLNINCFFPYLQALFDPEVAAHGLPVLWAGDVQEAVKDPLGNTVVKHLQGRKFN